MLNAQINRQFFKRAAQLLLPVFIIVLAQSLSFEPAKAQDEAATGTVLITGSNRGIGLELARSYATKGWTVIATCRKPEKATDLQAIAASHDNLTIEQLDINDADMIAGLADKLKDQPIDILLNNAAVLGEPDEQKFGTYKFDTFRWVLETNVMGPMRMAQAFVDHVAASDQKKIVAITSAQGSIGMMRSESLVFYNTSKAALNMAMRAASKAVADRGVTVALISPGAVDTAMMNLALSDTNMKFPLLTPQDSAAAVITAIDNYTFEMSGTFMDHRGKELPW